MDLLTRSPSHTAKFPINKDNKVTADNSPRLNGDTRCTKIIQPKTETVMQP